MNQAGTGNRLDLSHQFRAPLQVVFSAWTDPAFLAQWWGPVGCRVYKCEVDLRPGGDWRFGIETENGNREVYGKYLSITPRQALVFTWQWANENGPEEQTVVSILFTEDSETTTTVSLSQEEFTSQEICDQHRQGWNSSFESLTNTLGEGNNGE